MQKFIVPKEGLVVRDPKTKKPLLSSGEYKEYDTYWKRQLKQGSITVFDKQICKTETKKGNK